MSETKACANKNCRESSHNSKLQFFPFPKKLKTFRIWLERSGRKDLLKKFPEILDQTYFLCEKHFNKFEVMNNGKKRLPYDALPLEFGKIFKLSASRVSRSFGNPADTVKQKKTLKKSINPEEAKSSVKKIEIPAIHKPNDKESSSINEGYTIETPGPSHSKTMRKPFYKKVGHIPKENLKQKSTIRSEKNITETSVAPQFKIRDLSVLIKPISQLPRKKSNLIPDEQEFNVELFKDVDPIEIAAYKKLFPKLEDIAERTVHCTSCNSHIGTAPINEAIIKMHPVLRVIQCKKCYTFYTSGEFERGEDGSEFYCRWCGQGGEVYCCTKCPKVYCRRCIERNLSKSKVDEIQNNENWVCFACDPACMIQLKADFWALLNFIEKQKKDITNKSLSEKELNEAMSKDCSTCCANIKKRPYGKRKLSNSSDNTPPVKRKDSEFTHTEAPNIINETLAKRTQNKKSDSVTVQCSPDIGSMLRSSDAISSPNNSNPNTPSQIRLVRHLKVVPQPTQTPSQATQQNVLLDVRTAPPTKSPVFHTINGFRVDLNSAAQQETYRLPNGKLIQVRKQQPSLPSGNKISTANPQVAPPMLSIPTINSPIMNSAAAPLMMTPSTPTSSISITSGVRPPPPLLVPAAPRNVGPGVVRPTGRGRGRPPLKSTQIRLGRPTFPLPAPGKQVIEFRRNPSAAKQNKSQARLAENEIHITSLSQTTRKRKKPGQSAPVLANSPVDKAKTQFEIRVDNSMEVCQHIIGKMKTLTSSTAFKSVKTLTDVKDLTIHLSYLLTYAVGRFKTLHERCGDDMKVMGFDPECAKSDDDDIEILEPNTTCIELDSDENDADDAERETRKAVENLLCVENIDNNMSEITETITETGMPVNNENGDANKENETAELIELTDDQTNKRPAEAVTANGFEYDIVEISEPENDKNNAETTGNNTEEKDKEGGEKEPESSKKSDESVEESGAKDKIEETNDQSEKKDKESEEKDKGHKEVGNASGDLNKDSDELNEESEIRINNTEETSNTENEVSGSKAGEPDTVKRMEEENLVQNNVLKNDVNPTENIKKTSDVGDVNDSAEVIAEQSEPSIDTAAEIIKPKTTKIESDIISISEQDTSPEININEIVENIDNNSNETREDSTKEAEINGNKAGDSSEISKDTSLTENESSDPDTETEQLQKLLEENDEIESPSVENLSTDLIAPDSPKKRTNSEITINVNNVESIDEDIFENLIEEVNEVGEENTNDDSMDINDTSENSVIDDSMIEEIVDKESENTRDAHINSTDRDHVDGLSGCEDISDDENDLDLSLNSEIVLDPESEKVDEEMEGVIEDEYIEEEIVENYEEITEPSDSLAESTTKESVGIDSSL